MTHLCRFLRWKTYYGEFWRGPEQLQVLFDRNEVPYSCLRTARTWGPDEAPALPELCEPGRRCFEASTRLEGKPSS